MKIPFRGIVKNTPAGLAQDGELEDVLNLRYKDGAWRPIPDRSAIFSALPYTNVYIHSNSGYTHYLGVKSTRALEYFAQDIDGEPKLLKTPVALTTLTTDTAEFSQIGNVINIVDGGLKYLIWYDDAYVFISSNFDGEQNSTSLIGRVDLKVTRRGTETEREVAMYTLQQTFLASENFNQSGEGAKVQRDTAQSLFIKALAIEREKGKLHGFVLACSAIELYDGTYIRHSQPVLLGQAVDTGTRYSEGAFDYISSKAAFVDTALVNENATVTSGIGAPLGTPEGFTEDEENMCYRGNSLKQYRGTAGQSSSDTTLDPMLREAPNLYAQLVAVESGAVALMYATITCNKLQYKIPITIQETLKPLIKSISVFITPEVSMYKTSEASAKYVGSLYFGVYGSLRYRSFNWQPEIKTNEEIIKELAELRTFYKVHEIPFEKIQASPDWIDIDLKDKLGDLLLTQEALPYDDFSHHSTLPQVAMTYNSKLHVANYKTLLSRGWPYSYLAQESGIGQFASQQLSSENTITTLVKIKTTTGISTVIRTGSYASAYLPTMLSYPDSRAYEMIIYHSPKWQMMTVAEMQIARTIVNNYPTDISYWSNEEYGTDSARVLNMQTGVASNSYKANSRYIIGKRTFTLNETTASLSVGNTGQLGKIILVNSISGIVYYTEVSTEPITTLTWTIAINNYTNKYYTYKLTASKNANFSYWINTDLKPQTVFSLSGSNFDIIPPESNREQVYQNAMKVSEVNNPFTFPVQNTYQVGNGSITGIASNTIALSTGQFGEFPLYVFTTDGIWAMYVGGAEVNYTSSRPVSREVCNNPKSIKAIDTGVVFSTAKGIMVIAGSSTKELSEPIEGAVFDIDKLSLFKKALNHDKLTTLLSEVTGEDIHDYIASANVGYNYIESEIWFTNPLKSSYSYVFSKGLWYKVKQTGNRFVDDYPKQYLLTSTGDLVDIASEVLITVSEGKERAASQQIMLLTRPLKFGDVEFKQMLTAIMRGQLTTVNLIEEATPTDILHKKWTGIHVYGSYDGERWVFLGGAEKQGELNDIGTRIERTDCRYYRIALYGNVSLNSYINYLEMEGKQSILRTKLR